MILLVGREGLEPSVFLCQGFTAPCNRRYATFRYGAQRGIRTLNPLLAWDFKSQVYTNSTIWAYWYTGLDLNQRQVAYKTTALTYWTTCAYWLRRLDSNQRLRGYEPLLLTTASLRNIGYPTKIRTWDNRVKVCWVTTTPWGIKMLNSLNNMYYTIFSFICQVLFYFLKKFG